MVKHKKGQSSARTPPTASSLSFVDRNIAVLLPAVLLLALVVRILALLSYSGSIYGDYLLPDEQVYQAWARAILSAQPFVVHDFSPLPAYIMAIVYRIFGIDPYHVRMVNLVLGVLTCFFVYRIGRDLAGNIAGLIASVMAALYKPFVFFSIAVLKESLGLFLFSAAISLFVSLMKEDKPRAFMGRDKEVMGGTGGMPWAGDAGRALLLGVTAGLLINVRQNCIVLLPVFPALLVWAMRGKRGAFGRTTLMTTAFLAGLSLALAPFLVRNHHLTGEYRASPAGGFNLYLANNLANPYPYYRPVPFASPVPSLQATQFIIEASRREGRKLSTREASSFWTAEVIRAAMQHPGAMTWKLWQKTLALLNQYEADDNCNLGLMGRFVPFFRLPLLAFWFVFPLGMAWVVVNLTRSRETRALCVVAVIYASTLVAFFSSMRIRAPLLVIVMPWAAMGLEMAFNLVRRRISSAQGYGFLAALAVITAVGFLPVKGTGDLTSHYNLLGKNLLSKGLQDQAITYWKESSEMRGSYSSSADASLAGWYFARGDYEEMDRYLKGIPDDSCAAARKYELLGDAWMRRNRVDLAVPAYERSLRINGGQLRVMQKLIRACEATDPARAETKRAELDYIASFYEAG